MQCFFMQTTKILTKCADVQADKSLRWMLISEGTISQAYIFIIYGGN